MSNAQGSICYLNGISLQTIANAEQILRGLPKKGTRCELKVCTNRSGSRGTADVVAPKQSIRVRDEPRTPPPFVKTYDVCMEQEQSEIECKVLSDQVRVSPIVECRGVILQVDVEVKIPRGEKKRIKLEIECPDYEPRRVKIGGKWKDIK